MRTGRRADTSIDQLARDAREASQTQAAAEREAFAIIRRELDAHRLLAELSHSHGVIVAKYEVQQAADGSPRIRAGQQRLNVADFLTRELRLPWRDAALILRESHARQLRGDPPIRARELPRAELWRAFAQERQSMLASRRQAWEDQRESERLRKAQIQATFKVARQQASADRFASRPERQAARTAARASRALAQAELSIAITRERDDLRQTPAPSFEAFLQRRAADGDERALAELRRLRVQAPPPAGAVDGVIRSGDARLPANEVIWRAPALTWEVLSGGSVMYRQGTTDALRDDVDAVLVLRRDPALIEAGLRLAQARFGHTLDLGGQPDFQLKAARVAAEAGLQVTFSDPSLNDAMNARRAELLEQRLAPNRSSRPQPAASGTRHDAGAAPITTTADPAGIGHAAPPAGPRL